MSTENKIKYSVYLILGYGVLNMVAAAVTTYWFSFQMVDTSGAQPVYYTDYSEFVRAVPVAALSLTLAYFVSLRKKWGWMSAVFSSILAMAQVGLGFLMIYASENLTTLGSFPYDTTLGLWFQIVVIGSKLLLALTLFLLLLQSDVRSRFV